MLQSQVEWEKGSFRDPAGSVFFAGNEVYRSVADNSLPLVTELIKADFFQGLMESGRIVKTELVENKFSVPGKHVLHHNKIPFVIYPYEWSFTMLKDAALLTLDILKECLENGFILKDGTAWNVTYHDGKMVFFDVLSIDYYKEGQTWEGYQQFCNEFLYPLLLNSYKGVDFHQIYKGYLTGLDPILVREFFRFTDMFKPGVLKHVLLNTSLTKSKKISSSTIKGKLKLPKLALIGIVENLKNVITSLKENVKYSTWINYTSDNTYEDGDEKNKKDFVKAYCDSMPKGSQIIDLGCNIGNYSKIAAQTHKVISSDIDSNCIDYIYKNVITNSAHSIMPIVLNLMNPSPNVGWGLQERKSIFERLHVDGFLALALIHHICIANNVPLERFVQLLHKISPKGGVLEWVDKKDTMVQFLLRNRTDIFGDYTWEKFEHIVQKYFTIQKRLLINNELRTLLWLTEKN